LAVEVVLAFVAGVAVGALLAAVYLARRLEALAEELEKLVSTEKEGRSRG